MPISNDMTPGQVGWEAYNDGMEAGGRAWPRGTYGTPYMIKREVSSWEFAAAAVIADSRVAWEAAMAEIVAENDRLRAASSLDLTKVQREAIMAVIRNAQSSGIAFAYQKERKYPEYSVLRAIAEIETILEGNDDQVDGS